jgi:hypothetical protein
VHGIQTVSKLGTARRRIGPCGSGQDGPWICCDPTLSMAQPRHPYGRNDWKAPIVRPRQRVFCYRQFHSVHVHFLPRFTSFIR